MTDVLLHSTTSLLTYKHTKQTFNLLFMHIIGKLIELKRLVKNATNKKKTTFQNRRYMLVEKKRNEKFI